MLINNFSPNMLKVFDKCAYEFFLKYMQKLSLPQRSNIFEKGKKIHALANYYLKGFDICKMEKALTEEEKITWESLKNNAYFKLDVVNTEYNLSCKVGKYWIGGRIDAFMKSNNDYFILDYKTGNIPQNPEWDFQTITYLLCADKFLEKKGGYDSLKFVYLGLKNNTQKEIVLTEESKKQYEEKILSTCKNIDSSVNSGVFVKNKEQCKNCEYKKLCE